MLGFFKQTKEVFYYNTGTKLNVNLIYYLHELSKLIPNLCL